MLLKTIVGSKRVFLLKSHCRKFTFMSQIRKK